MRSEFKSAVVIGGGTMGSGIAQAFLQAGMELVLIEVDQERSRMAFEHVKAGVRSKLLYDNGRRETPEVDEALAEVMARFSTQVGLEFPGSLLNPQVVVETVFENAGVKSGVLNAVEGFFPNCQLVATNTSSLSVDLLASGLTHPEKFIGMHFFNPVPRSTLIELVAGKETSASTVELAREVVGKLGKESILVHDSPGFATSRLGIILGIEAIRMVEEGVASPEDIDRGMVLGYKHPMGPLKLTDLVGLDIRLAISEYLESKLGPRFAPPELLREMVARGDLGKKSGKGFYEW